MKKRFCHLCGKEGEVYRHYQYYQDGTASHIDLCQEHSSQSKHSYMVVCAYCSAYGLLVKNAKNRERLKQKTEIEIPLDQRLTIITLPGCPKCTFKGEEKLSQGTA